MAGLLRSLPNRERDLALLKKTATTKQPPIMIKGSQSIIKTIDSITTMVESKLGKYKELYDCLRTEDSVREYFDAIIYNGIASIDTETSSLDPITCDLAGICLYTPGRKPVYIPVGHVSPITYMLRDNQVSREFLQDLLNICETNNVKWIVHYGKFDVRVIKNQFNLNMSVFWDTQLAAKAINPNESAALKDLHFKYCATKDSESLTYDKLFNNIPFTYIPISAAYLYAAGDPLKTFELYEYQKAKLNRRKIPGVYNVFRNIEIPLMPVIAEMEEKGIGFDLDFASELSKKYNSQLKLDLEEVHRILNTYKDKIDHFKRSHADGYKLSDPINVGSSTQLAIVLYDILGYKSPNRNLPRGTGGDILRALRCPLSNAILNYRKTKVLLSTFIDKLPNSVNTKTGRIHCKFNQDGTDTGRISSSDPNMQNIPARNKEIRKMFIPAQGNVFISCDFSQQEPRILAHMSGDKALIEAYAEGRDIYAWIASKIYDERYEDCKETFPDGTDNPAGEKRRSSVKSIVLGVMYGRGAKAIAEQIGCTPEEAQKIIDLFFDTFPLIKKWMDKTIADAHKTGYVETAWGRRRVLKDINLTPYEVTWSDGQPVDVNTRSRYIRELSKAWGREERKMVIDRALKANIILKDNRGYIAEAERQAINTPIQGSAADMTKIAMIRVQNDAELRSLGCCIVLQVHDELICECPRENADIVGQRISQIMIDSAKGVISVPMKCDVKTTLRWYGEAI